MRNWGFAIIASSLVSLLGRGNFYADFGFIDVSFESRAQNSLFGLLNLLRFPHFVSSSTFFSPCCLISVFKYLSRLISDYLIASQIAHKKRAKKRNFLEKKTESENENKQHCLFNIFYTFAVRSRNDKESFFIFSFSRARNRTTKAAVENFYFNKMNITIINSSFVRHVDSPAARAVVKTAFERFLKTQGEMARCILHAKYIKKIKQQQLGGHLKRLVERKHFSCCRFCDR